MNPLALPAFLATGAIAGLLAGLLGIGGGVVIVPALMVIFGYLHIDGAWAPHQAVATSLATVIATGSASAYAHHRRGAVDWATLRVLGPALLIGAGLAALAGGLVPPLWLKRMFAVFLLYAGTRMALGSQARSAVSLPRPATLTGIGVGFGALSALLGVGGGIMVVPYLARHGLQMQRAVATASACGVPIAVAGSIGFVMSGWARPGLPPASLGFVYWPAALAILVASVPMATVGARLAHRLPTTALKRVFAALVLAVGLRLLLG